MWLTGSAAAVFVMYRRCSNRSFLIESSRRSIADIVGTIGNPVTRSCFRRLTTTYG
jgi:hypothetical protein